MKRYMNKFALAMAMVMGLSTLTSCEDDEWGNDNPDYQNVFIVAFADWGPKSNNDKTYTVNQGSQQVVPVQLWCEGTRSFDAQAFVYADSKLTLGVDYQVTDASGNVLQQDGNGAWVLTWDLRSPDNTNNHRVQNIYLKALNGAKGDVTVMTFDPKDVDDAGKIKISNSYTPNNITNEYEVHSFTQNYKVKVTIK